MAFIPHTPKDVEDMLAKIGVAKLEDIFDEIPSNIPAAELTHIPEGMNESDLLIHAKNMAEHNPYLTCFMGAGCYDHHIPAIIWDLATRGEFLTSYTPYQAEVSQGNLQVLYEFQTLLAELFALDVANASLYDGATALAEAILMAKRIQKNSHAKYVLIPHYLHPYYKETIHTIIRQQNIELIELPIDPQTGVTNVSELSKIKSDEFFAICMVQPNFLGLLEPVHELCDWAKQQHLISIACVNPSTLGALQAPGYWGQSGVDIACAEGQPFGIPMSSGGPMVGFIATKKQHLRQLPGRIVGRTVDQQQRPGFVLTLQAREQHIRRGKATSNICTNQGLNVVAATIYMSLMGPLGLKTVAEACYQNTHFLIEELCKIPGVQLVHTAPFFHEALLQFELPLNLLLKQFEQEKILPGLDIEPFFPEFKNCLLICATEKRNISEITSYIQCVKNTINQYQSNPQACHMGV